jgi:hypothetical protein
LRDTGSSSTSNAGAQEHQREGGREGGRRKVKQNGGKEEGREGIPLARHLFFALSLVLVVHHGAGTPGGLHSIERIAGGPEGGREGGREGRREEGRKEV